ncbi:MAG: hypothetical protein M3033_08085 [Acidobacteriota bacterium]|nr:hypothetical protein [Acidobacteriota bacterium]
MKLKFLCALFCLCAFSFPAFAQSVVVTPKKTTYKRPKPLSEYKKSFVLIRPKVNGISPALTKKIESSISFEKNFDFNVREEVSEIQWLEEASYKVNYNKNGILGIILSVVGSGAYPSEYEKSVVVNLKTGERVVAKDVFVKLSEFVAKLKRAQQGEIKKAIADIKKNEPDEENPEQLFENTNFTIENLDEFSINNTGVTFRYDYGFPHVALALQPEGRYFYSWSQLKPFVRRDGLFAKFIR